MQELPEEIIEMANRIAAEEAAEEADYKVWRQTRLSEERIAAEAERESRRETRRYNRRPIDHQRLAEAFARYARQHRIAFNLRHWWGLGMWHVDSFMGSTEVSAQRDGLTTTQSYIKARLYVTWRGRLVILPWFSGVKVGDFPLKAIEGNMARLIAKSRRR